MLGLDLELHRRRSFRDGGGRVDLNLTNGPREGDHADAAYSGTAKRGGARVHGRPGRVHVVDDARRPRDLRATQDDAPADVPAPLVERQAALVRERARSAEEVSNGDPPHASELVREAARRDVASAPRSLGIARDRDDALGVRPGNDLGDEACGLERESPPAAFLPCPDEQRALRS